MAEITRFYTVNSVYEVDWSGPRVRRVKGANDPTPRVGEDGVWRDAVSVGHGWGGLLIVWEVVDGIGKSTVTSHIVREERVEAVSA